MNEASLSLEPFGHDSALSKLERYLNGSDLPAALHRVRTQIFDIEACMSTAPMQYLSEEIRYREDLPGSEWIVGALEAFVRGEFPAVGTRPEAAPRSFQPKVQTEYLSRDFLHHFLRSSEALVDRLLPGVSHGDETSMSRAIYDLLCHPSVGSKKNMAHNDADEFERLLVNTIRSESRLLFLIPGFPFKDQNRFRVPFDAGLPDLADISFLIRLHNLTQALFQVHPYGADVLVLSDGFLYADIFHVGVASVDRYFRSLREVRNELNLQGTVSIIDLGQLVNRADSCGNSPRLIADRIEEVLRRLHSTTDILDEPFSSLLSGMRRNLNSRKLLDGVNEEEAWRAIYAVGATTPRPFQAAATEAAYKYAAINLAIRWVDLLPANFPGAIRGTVHPKPGQFALAGSGGAYAWNGVAWAPRWPESIDDIEVRPFHALADHGQVRQVLFTSGAPAFFTGGLTDG